MIGNFVSPSNLLAAQVISTSERVFRHNKFLLPSPPVLRGRRAGDDGVNDLETQCPYSLQKPLTPDPSPRITGARGARLYGLCQMTSAEVLGIRLLRVVASLRRREPFVV
jgi:hypothetical protein